jgi:hypothetical protein
VGRRAVCGLFQAGLWLASCAHGGVPVVDSLELFDTSAFFGGGLVSGAAQKPRYSAGWNGRYQLEAIINQKP